MAFVVPLTVRYTINQTYGLNVVNNIIDVEVNVDPALVTAREDACRDVGEVVLGAWDDQMLISQVNDVSANSVSWVDLATAAGSTGVVTTDGTHTWPAAGDGTGDPMPGNVAVLYSKALAGAGRDRRNGRMYLCGVSEAFTPSSGPNEIDLTTLGTLTTRGTNFLNAINGGPFDSTFVVVHVLTRDADGDPLTGDNRDVASFVPFRLLATQRRRLR